jgi:CMP-N,N'-diacetyllegionaminic acid synthase
MSRTILGIIPARSGSKGVPDKNIRELDNRPLIDYTISAALDSDRLTDFIVSTDSEKYARISEASGASVPFIRPDELATDEAASIDVVQHAVREYERQNEILVDVTVLLQPTTPLRTGTDIDEALSAFLNSDNSSLISCYEALDAHPNHMFEAVSETELAPIRAPDETPHRRQLFDPVYILNGAIYITNRSLLFDDENFYDDSPLKYEMPRERSVNIDEPFDLELVEFLLSRETV